MSGKTGKLSHRLLALAIVGGFLDGERFDLADGLNCVIGVHGTGKTTVLEFVRAAMDAMPNDRAARRRIEGLVDVKLQVGRVQLGGRVMGSDPFVYFQIQEIYSRGGRLTAFSL